MTATLHPPKLYLLTSDDPIDTLLDKLERAFDTGAVSLLQVRRQHTLLQFDLMTLYQEVELIVALAGSYGIDVVMHDNMELASHFCTGIHLTGRDASIRAARQMLGTDVVIGRTCHSDLALFKEAKKDGANYGAMGTVFTSITRPRAKVVEPQLLQRAGEHDLPLCVIGGITLDNAPILQAQMAGARLDYIAITTDIMHHPSQTIAAKCRAWQRVLNDWYQ